MCITKSLTFLTTLLIIADCTTPKVSLKIPLHVKRSSDVRAFCLYDTLSGTPNDVKWFKDGVEFYSYKFGEIPRKKRFHVHGVNLDIEKSGSAHILLSNVQPNASGIYSCEVSTDAPFLNGQVDAAYMYVIDVPEKYPVLTHKKQINAIIANCTSPPSYPPINITWIVNNEKIYKGVDTLVATQRDSGLRGTVTQITKSTLVVPLSGTSKIRCVASLYNLYHKESELVVYDRDSYLGRSITPYGSGFKPKFLETGFIIYFSLVTIVGLVVYGCVLYKS